MNGIASGLLEPCAGKLASTVLRGRGSGDATPLPDLSLGDHVRKGERGATVVYADRFTPEDEKRRGRETGGEAHVIPFLKRFTVFNVAQCDGLPDDIATVAPPPPPGLIEPRVEAFRDPRMVRKKW